MRINKEELEDMANMKLAREQKIEINREKSFLDRKAFLEKRTQILIDNIKEYGDLYITKANYYFEDKKTLKAFYNYLKKRYDKYSSKKDLKPIEKLEVELFERVNEQIAKSCSKSINKDTKISKSIDDDKNIFLERVKELKQTIKKIKRLPASSNNESEEIYKFKDGTIQRTFYERLRKECLYLVKKEELTELEKLKLIKFKEISELVKTAKKERDTEKNNKKRDTKQLKQQEYNVEVKTKTDEVLKAIEEYGIIPLAGNDLGLPYAFSDGITYITFYNFLRKSSIFLKKKEVISEADRIIIDNYERMSVALDKEIKKEEKEVKEDNLITNTASFIEIILKIDRLPKKYEYAFEDGTDAHTFYELLKVDYRFYKYKSKSKRDNKYKNIVNCLDNIKWHLGYIHLKKYYARYKHLNIMNGYISRMDNHRIDLRSWLDEQRDKYNLEEKTDLQKEHERMLSNLCENWYLPNTNTLEMIKQNVKKK